MQALRGNNVSRIKVTSSSPSVDTDSLFAGILHLLIWFLVSMSAFSDSSRLILASESKRECERSWFSRRTVDDAREATKQTEAAHFHCNCIDSLPILLQCSFVASKEKRKWDIPWHILALLCERGQSFSNLHIFQDSKTLFKKRSSLHLYEGGHDPGFGLWLLSVLTVTTLVLSQSCNGRTATVSFLL